MSRKRIENYPLPSEVPGVETTKGWRFVHHDQIKDWRNRPEVDFSDKLFAFDNKNRTRMIKNKGICGAIREILYSRICEKLGILCESSQFIILSEEHIEMAKGKPYQAGIFILPKSIPLRCWIGRYYKGSELSFHEVNIKNPDDYYQDIIANTLFRCSEAGEYEVTAEGYLFRVDIDTIFSNFILPFEEGLNSNIIINQILGWEKILWCKKELNGLVKDNKELKRALRLVCKKVASWTDKEIYEITEFPLEFQGNIYRPLSFRLISEISQPVARLFVH